MINKRILSVKTDEMVKGVGQIMLQESSYTGTFILLGIFMDSVIMGIACLLATYVATVTARYLKYDEGNIGKGLYGFNAALVGVALTHFFSPGWIVWVTICLGSIVTVFLQRCFLRLKIPGFTLPFILVTWACVFLIHQYSDLGPSHGILEIFEELDALIEGDLSGLMVGVKGFGEVIFQGSTLAGLLFAIGVYLKSPIAALYGLACSIMAAVMSMHVGHATQTVGMGLYSFNAVLTAIYFAGPRRRDGIWVFIAVVIAVTLDTTIINQQWSTIMQAGGVLTAPFVLSTWITLILQIIVRWVEKRFFPNSYLSKKFQELKSKS